MTTLICITTTFIIILAGIAWLMAGIGRWGNEAMDDIMDKDRHEYKDAEREVELSSSLNFPEMWMKRVIHNLDNTDKATWDDAMDNIINRDRHEYKDAERGVSK